MKRTPVAGDVVMQVAPAVVIVIIVIIIIVAVIVPAPAIILHTHTHSLPCLPSLGCQTVPDQDTALVCCQRNGQLLWMPL